MADTGEDCVESSGILLPQRVQDALLIRKWPRHLTVVVPNQQQALIAILLQLVNHPDERVKSP
ncbi:MAG: hypothetical protein BroJett001_31540 [Chloroflexota bacterium]|nr:MAG: hypothetical protein BroJett001_31540 [Chloroflexota bacterium]